MSEQHSNKELAYLFDLYVAPDWGERFAALMDEHLTPPKKGRALYVGPGTGGHALALAKRAGKDMTLIGVDESEERLALARAKATAAKLDHSTEFRLGQFEALEFEDEQFDLVVGDASLIPVERLPEIVAELARVAAPGATVALNLPTSSSFGEFFSIYWEALASAGVAEAEGHLVEHLLNERLTISDAEAMLAREGLDEVRSWTNVEEFNYPAGAEFFNAPLMKYFLLRDWLTPLSDEALHAPVLAGLTRIIDEERCEADFTLSIKATLIAGHKPR